MKVVRQTESELVLEDSTLWLAAFMGAAALFLAYGAASTGKKGTLIAAALFVLFAFLCLRKTTIAFDSLRRMVNWQRLRYFQRSSGSIPYDDIKDIVIETSLGGTATYRLAILTSQGSWPMSDGYGGNSDRYAALAKEVRQFLKLGPSANAAPAPSSAPGDANLDASIRALLAQGRKIDAIKLMRTTQTVDLATAKDRVDEIERRMHTG